MNNALALLTPIARAVSELVPDEFTGIVPGLPSEQYHRHPAISSTMLSALKRSPQHFYALHVRQGRPPPAPPTDAMRAGTLLHCVALEPAEFEKRYTVRPAWVDGRNKAGKAWIEEHTKPGLEFVLEEELELAMQQRAALMAVPELEAFLAPDVEDAWSELSCFWVDQPTGARCRCRPDKLQIIGDGRIVLLDLKSTKDPDPREFARSVWNFGYHRQAAHYCAGVEAATGREVAAFMLGAVSSSYPHIAVPFLLDDEAQEAGRQERRELLQLLKDCAERASWPAYGEGPVIISLPRWRK